MLYFHRDHADNPIDLPVGKVVCVGRNYVDHIQELNNELPDQPLLFMKPATSLCNLNQPLTLPKAKGSCHNELEVAILLSSSLSCATPEQAQTAIWGVGLGLDLTLRDLQNELKQKGLPWERAKAFDGACPMSGFLPYQQLHGLADLQFRLSVNDIARQSGNTGLMIWDAITLLCEISQVFTLMPGDIVMTGTPKGVGPIIPGDKLDIELMSHFSVTTQIKQDASHVA
ncbi:fumarylacetoacetate hydrolase family protein [Aliiglaciecola litoralis]|uniref:Fumarylacetoacetate hydrolase family protein n=1 Tax=Aliiglaciecola litoralis TaxID=582857 RepID=A0ABN1LN53_9ALTE